MDDVGVKEQTVVVPNSRIQFLQVDVKELVGRRQSPASSIEERFSNTAICRARDFIDFPCDGQLQDEVEQQKKAHHAIVRKARSRIFVLSNSFIPEKQRPPQGIQVDVRFLDREKRPTYMAARHQSVCLLFTSKNKVMLRCCQLDYVVLDHVVFLDIRWYAISDNFDIGRLQIYSCMFKIFKVA